MNVEIRTVGVIGAGVMGTGLAQGLAQAERRVALIDVSEAVLARARREIENGVRMQGLIGGARADPRAVLERIDFTTDDGRLAEADFVIESLPERWEIKRAVYGRLDGLCPPHCVLASNTSAIPITRIGAAAGRPDRTLGIHFMNPVPLKKTVEVIRGYHTSDATVETARGLLQAMGKDCIVVKDGAGFVANRLSHLFMNEAVNLVQERIAEPRDIDGIFKRCYGHAMGPLETADLIGLDTVADTLDVLYDHYRDPRFRCSPLLRQMVDAGLCGRKSGSGFYTYRTNP